MPTNWLNKIYRAVLDTDQPADPQIVVNIAIVHLLAEVDRSAEEDDHNSQLFLFEIELLLVVQCVLLTVEFAPSSRVRYRRKSHRNIDHELLVASFERCHAIVVPLVIIELAKGGELLV